MKQVKKRSLSKTRCATGKKHWWLHREFWKQDWDNKNR